MLKAIFFLSLILSLYSCKKPAPRCGACACINTSNLQYLNQYVDSNTVDQLVLGNWYLQQQNITDTASDCGRNCYCSNQYVFSFLPNKTLVRSLPGNITDTLTYGFIKLNDSSNLVFSLGFIRKNGDTTYLAEIFYTSNYLSLQPPSGFYQYYDNYPQTTFFLTR